MKTIIVILGVFLIVSCRAQNVVQKELSNRLPYQADSLLSDKQGQLRDSLLLYFPSNLFRDTFNYYWYYDPRYEITPFFLTSNNTKAGLSKFNSIPIEDIHDSTEMHIDTFSLYYFSYYMHKFRDPILSNYYLNKTVYRITFFPGLIWSSFTLSVIEENGNFYVLTKKAKDRIDLPHISYESNKRIVSEAKYSPLSINTKKPISSQDFYGIDSLFNSSVVSSLPQRQKVEDCATDAESWLFEVHDKNGYYFIETCNLPKVEVLKAIKNEMVKLSSLDAQTKYEFSK